MITGFWALTAASLLLGILVFFKTKKGLEAIERQENAEKSWLPQSLKNAKLVMVEQAIECEGLNGRLDRAYSREGKLFLLEFKKRSVIRVYETDRLELSLQAWILRKTGKKTSGIGHVVIILPDEQKIARSVNLLNDEECERHLRKFQDLMSGELSPKKAHRNKCTGCQHKGICFDR